MLKIAKNTIFATESMKYKKNMNVQISDSVSWHRETDLLRKLLYFTLNNKNMRML